MRSLNSLRNSCRSAYLASGGLSWIAVRRRDRACASRNFAASHVGRDHAFLDQLVRVVALEHAGLGDLALRAEHEAHFAGSRTRSRRASARALARIRYSWCRRCDLRQQRADLRQRLRRGPPRGCPRRPRSRPGCRSGARASSSPLRRTSSRLTSPSRSTCMSQTKHRRSTLGFSEQMPLDSVSGSIGTTKPGKYTEVARSCASSSSGVPGTHVMRDVGDRDDQAEAVAVGFAIDRVVEILGVLAVDGDQRQCCAGRRARRRSRHRPSAAPRRPRRALPAGTRAGSRGRGSPPRTASDAVSLSPSTASTRPIGGRCGSGACTISAHHQLAVLRIARARPAGSARCAGCGGRRAPRS